MPLARRIALAAAKTATQGAGAAYLNAASQPGDLKARIDRANASIPAGAAAGVLIPAGIAGAKGAGNIIAPVLRRAGAVTSELVDAGSRALSGQSPASIAANVTPEASSAGRQAALQYLTDMGVTPDALRQAALDANGKPITTFEAIGPQGIGQATGLVRRNGTAAQVADAAMQARMSGRPQRILQDVTDATGVDPSAAAGHIDTLVRQGRKMAGPAYDAALSGTDPIMTPALAQWMETPVAKKAMASAAQEVRNIPGADPHALGLPIDPDTGAVGSTTPGLNDMVPQPTAATWDLIRKHVGDQVDRDAFGAPLPDAVSRGNYALNANKKFLTDALAGDGTPANPGAIPGYRAALDQASDYLGIKSAFENGQGVLFGKTNKTGATDLQNPDSFAKWFAGLKPIEQEAAKSGIANDILSGVQNGTLRPGTFALPHVQMKLATAFGEDGAAQLTSSMDAEHAMMAAEARMRPNLNSTTGNVVGQIADNSDPAADAAMGALGALGHAATGRPVAAVKSLATGLSPFVSAGRAPIDMAARNELANFGFADPADTAHWLEAYQAAHAPQVSLPPPSQFVVPMLSDQTAREAGANMRPDGGS
jgi:hypothetical protein